MEKVLQMLSMWRLFGWLVQKGMKKEEDSDNPGQILCSNTVFDKDYSLMGFSGLKLSQDDWRTLLLLHVKNKLKEIEVAGDNLT
jgi:hypothetical protein